MVFIEKQQIILKNLNVYDIMCKIVYVTIGSVLHLRGNDYGIKVRKEKI